MSEGAAYAENLPYWKTSKSSPDKWLERAEVELERAGGEVLSSGHARVGNASCFMLRFELEGETFKVIWPVLSSKYEGNDQDRSFLLSARRQAATMLYHDIKSSCVKARALGARTAFFAHLEMPGGAVASELAGADFGDVFPKLLGTSIIDAEVIE